MKPVTINPKANVFRILWIMLYSFFVTLKYCLKSISFGLLAKDKLRPNVDKLLFDWSSRLVKAVRIQWRVEGDLESKMVDGRSMIFMCNHASAYDIPLAFTALPGSIRMIAKKELFSIPILSRAMRQAEFPSIDRQNRQQAIKDLQFARNKMKSGIRIWMFPEGTRSVDGQLRPLKKGGIRLAIDTNAIIVPIVMQDIEHILPRKQWFQMRLNQKVNIKIGQAIDCREFAIDKRHQVSDMVYNQMQQMLADEEQ